MDGRGTRYVRASAERVGYDEMVPLHHENVRRTSLDRRPLLPPTFYHGCPARAPSLLKRFLRNTRAYIFGFQAVYKPLGDRFSLKTSLATTLLKGNAKANVLVQSVVSANTSRVEVRTFQIFVDCRYTMNIDR